MNDNITEIYGCYTHTECNLKDCIENQYCPYINKKCLKMRKSTAEITIGTCTVRCARDGKDIIICPHRLLERKQIFIDCLHLLTTHEPGNELHIISEIAIPGGNVDYFLVSASAEDRKVKDFVGIELQTLDTTGTIWPERQRLAKSYGIGVDDKDINSKKPFNMNWKMTAKTILIQMHHKAETFENINKHLVLVIQTPFLDYMKKSFLFNHIGAARIGDSVHFHSYDVNQSKDKQSLKLSLSARISTDVNGIQKCLGLQANAKIELIQIVKMLESKISDETQFML